MVDDQEVRMRVEIESDVARMKTYREIRDIPRGLHL